MTVDPDPPAPAVAATVWIDDQPGVVRRIAVRPRDAARAEAEPDTGWVLDYPRREFDDIDIPDVDTIAVDGIDMAHLRPRAIDHCAIGIPAP